MGRAGTTGRHAAGPRGGARSRDRWAGARTRGGDQSALRGQVPTVTAPAWVEHVIWWHVYPLGFVGAFPASVPPDPREHRLRRVAEWFDHAITLGASGIALGPIFASRTHGYDTTDHYRIDPRLGAQSDVDSRIAGARRRGLRVLLDGGFNHVGVEFGKYLAAADDSVAARWF